MNIHQLFDLSGQVGLVSGASRNMGRATAVALAEAGADLVICARHMESLEDTAHEVAKLGRRAVPVVCDVTDLDQIRALFRRVDQEFGKIDVMAAIPGSNYLYHPEDIPMDKFVEILQGVLVSKLCCAQEAGRRMLAQGKGSIILMSSIGGINALARAILPTAWVWARSCR